MAKKQSSNPAAGLNKKDQQLFSEFLKQQVKGTKETSTAQEKLNKNLEDARSIQDEILSNEQAILAVVEKRKSAESKINDLSTKLVDLQKEHEKTGSKEAATGIKRLENQIKQYKKQKDIYTETAKAYNLNRKALKDAKKNNEVQKEHLELLKEASDHASELVEKYEGILEPFEELDDAIKKLPGGEFLSKALGVDNLKEKMQDAIVERITEGKMAGKGMMASLGPLIPLLVAALALYKAFEFDKELTKFSKDLDISKDAAYDLSIEAEHIAHDMHLVGATGKEVEATLVAMRQEFGVMANEHSNELVKSVTALQTQMGLSAEEAFALNGTATLLNMSLEELSAEAGTLGEGLIGSKQTLKEMSKLPKSIVVAFKGTSKELEKAVIKGKLLGLSLDKVAKIGEGMLDIESSIEKQFTAQVLTGKQINLNAAREYALTGQYAKLQDEIVSQAGSLDEFQKMGPLQQKAMADALGMSTQEMTEILTKQKELTENYGLSASRAEEIMNMDAESAKNLKDKEKTYFQMLQEEKNQKEASAKFQESLNKLMMAFEKIAFPIVEVLGVAFDGIAVVVDGITSGVAAILTPIQMVQDSIKSIFDGSKSIGDVWNGLGTTLQTFLGVFTGLLAVQQIYVAWKERELIAARATEALEKAKLVWQEAQQIAQGAIAAIQQKGLLRTIGEAAMTAFKSAAAVPFVGPLLGAAAAAGAVALGMKYMNDGVINPKGGMVVSGPEGSIGLNKDDSVVAGTDLFGDKPANNASSNNGEVVALLKELIAKVSQPTVIKFGSKTIEEFESQINMRKSYTSQIDRGYGATS